MTTSTLAAPTDTVAADPSDEVIDPREAAILRATTHVFPAALGEDSQQLGAGIFTADPGPAVIANGGVYGIFASADAIAIHGTATGEHLQGIGMWGDGPVIGVYGKSGADGAGVSGEGFYGVVGRLGINKQGAAVRADGAGGVGVDANGSTIAVIARANTASGTGVAASGGQFGIKTESQTGTGILANGSIAVHAQATGGTGTGVVAFGAQSGVQASSSGIGVEGSGETGVKATGDANTGIGLVALGATGVSAASSHPTGTGVLGHGTNGPGVVGTSGQATGVVGKSEFGLGGDFSGTAAAIRLRPAEAPAGPPKTGEHQVGELYVDSKPNLYFCVQSGKPGLWRMIEMK